MAKKSELLGATNPERLTQLAIGSFLSVFVLFGSFAVTDASILLLTGDSTLLVAAGYGGGRGTDGLRGADGLTPAERKDINARLQKMEQQAKELEQKQKELERKAKEQQQQQQPAKGGGGGTGGGSGSTPTKQGASAVPKSQCLSAFGCSESSSF